MNNSIFFGFYKLYTYRINTMDSIAMLSIVFILQVYNFLVTWRSMLEIHY